MEKLIKEKIEIIHTAAHDFLCSLEGVMFEEGCCEKVTIVHTEIIEEEIIQESIVAEVLVNAEFFYTSSSKETLDYIFSIIYEDGEASIDDWEVSHSTLFDKEEE